MKKLMLTKDANTLLKEEIYESSLRLKAAKHGHMIQEIAPSYNQSFYLPDKNKYFDATSIHK